MLTIRPKAFITETLLHIGDLIKRIPNGNLILLIGILYKAPLLFEPRLIFSDPIVKHSLTNLKHRSSFKRSFSSFSIQASALSCLYL